MDRHAQIFEVYRLGTLVGQKADILGQAQRSSHLVGCVMIAGDDKHRNLQLAQPAELFDQVEPGVVIAPIAVVEVTCDQNEIDSFLDGEVDQPREGASRRPPNPLDGRVLITLKAFERAIEMDISSMNKSDRHEEEPKPLVTDGATSTRRIENHRNLNDSTLSKCRGGMADSSSRGVSGQQHAQRQLCHV